MVEAHLGGVFREAAPPYLQCRYSHYSSCILIVAKSPIHLYDGMVVTAIKVFSCALVAPQSLV